MWGDLHEVRFIGLKTAAQFLQRSLHVVTSSDICLCCQNHCFISLRSENFWCTILLPPQLLFPGRRQDARIGILLEAVLCQRWNIMEQYGTHIMLCYPTYNWG